MEDQTWNEELQLKTVKYRHFKMESIRSALNLVTKYCFMCTVDLKDAYYSVKVKYEFQCYLKFQWKQKLLKFVCLHNELGPRPRKLTKISKAPTSYLRLRAVPISGSIDNFFTKASSYSQCVRMFMVLL